MKGVRKTSRRALFAAAGAVGVSRLLGTGLPRALAAGAAPIVLAAGDYKYEWVAGWSKLPAGMTFGNTHGCIVVDSQQRIFMNTDTENAVIVFDADGNFIKSWGKDWSGGLHGMHIFKENGQERLLICHKGRHEVVKTTLDGDVLLTLPFPDKAGVYTDIIQYKPTSATVAPNGDIYVGDGYGKSWIHQYTAAGDYVRSWGGLGTAAGQFNTPHGVWIDTRKPTPVLMVCDRENNRIQVFDLNGKFLSMITGIVRRPCHIDQRGDVLVIADLGGRITLLDKDNNLIGHLGENPDPAKRANNGVTADLWRDGEFTAPHCAKWDSQGNLYVLDWNQYGRITKLKAVNAVVVDPGPGPINQPADAGVAAGGDDAGTTGPDPTVTPSPELPPSDEPPSTDLVDPGSGDTRRAAGGCRIGGAGSGGFPAVLGLLAGLVARHARRVSAGGSDD